MNEIIKITMEKESMVLIHIARMRAATSTSLSTLTRLADRVRVEE